jgi:hypothetical protein
VPWIGAFDGSGEDERNAGKKRRITNTSSLLEKGVEDNMSVREQWVARPKDITQEETGSDEEGDAVTVLLMSAL